ITVLLALSVFMSIISGMLPRSSTLPRVTIYLFILLAISVLTVVDSIIIVYIYNKEE
ncbi:neuronal acetylcholine receptor subunit alpha-6, partial [Biomphalaria pfeifferi]